MAEDKDLSGESKESLAKKISVHEERYLRLAAEYENFRKRAAREKEAADLKGKMAIVEGLVETFDDLLRIGQLVPSEVDSEVVLQGTCMVSKKLFKAMEGQGLEVIRPMGSVFDPELHEAVSMEVTLIREEDHLVGKVFQVGYMFNGNLLRPARVVVKKYEWNDKGKK